MKLAIVLIGLAVIERVGWDLGANVELVTMASVIAGMYLSRKWSWLIPVIIMVVSDWVLGWGWISVFTWTGFVAMVRLPELLKKVDTDKLVTGLMSGLVGNLFFFSWTNLGVWLTDSWGMYSHDWSGLMQCYINGLPFLKVQLVSSLVFVPLAVMVMEVGKGWGELWFKKECIFSWCSEEQKNEK